jgi:hypothetical protein
MFAWVRNAAINYAIKLVKAELDKAIAKDSSIGYFRDGFYRDTNAVFLANSLNKLEPGVASITPIQLIKRRIAPLRDDVESVVVKVLDGLAP